MEDVNRLLDESSIRLQQIADLAIENLTDEAIQNEISELYEISKEMDNVKHEAKVQQAAINGCKVTLSQIDEPWDCIIQQMFDEKLESGKQKSKAKHDYHKALQKHVNRKGNEEMEEEMEIVEEAQTAVDPWTKQPIQQPVQSALCKHVYDKRSIACIIRNRKHFKCPYVGCQHVVTQADLVDLD